MKPLVIALPQNESLAFEIAVERIPQPAQGLFELRDTGLTLDGGLLAGSAASPG